MPGFLLHSDATVQCSHGGKAQATAPVLNVLVDKHPIVVQTVPYIVTGCPFNVSGSPVPCVTARWVEATAAVRIKSFGMPVLLATSQATCDPNMTPVIIGPTQIRVVGS